MLKDSNIDLVKVLLWCCDSTSTALENRIKSFSCKSFSFTNKPTGSCGPNK